VGERVEIITGRERRRRWSEDERRQLTAAAFAPGAVVAHVARCHGVAESCLYAWRKRFAGAPRDGTSDQPRLIPVLVDGVSLPSPALPLAPPARPAIITLADGTRVEIAADYPVAALKALIAVLKAR
jgi:transposase